MACIIYYKNLDYDDLPTARKRARLVPNPANAVADGSFTSNYNSPNTTTTTNTSNYNSYGNSSDYSYGNNSNYNHQQPQPQPQQQSYNRTPQFGDSSSNYLNGDSNDSMRHKTSYSSSVPYTNENSNSCTRDKFYEPIISSSGGSNSFNNNSRDKPYTSSSYTSDNSNASSRDRFYDPIVSSSSSGGGRGVARQAPDKKILLETLEKYFKFKSFRTNQFESINATCMGLDTLILMPTGGGKSICYQLPAILTEGITIVVSPLKSLIDDQVNHLREMNIRTSALSGESSEGDSTDLYYDLRSAEPKHKLLYVTPEKIGCSGALMHLFKSLHSRNLLARFVIDEAHCVSMWGSDFRPDYRKLGKLREMFRDVPIMALTATAPPKVRDDIYDQLKMNKRTGKTFIQSFNRPNLKFEVRSKMPKRCLAEICNLIKRDFQKQCGIIYCLSRNDCSLVSQALRDQGITSAPYHAGLSDTQRTRVTKAWWKGTFQVVCATVAFGMGIDKSDVRFVIHYSVPKSLEGYYQEAGRAGRDGQFARCILYFNRQDIHRMKGMQSRGTNRKDEDRTRDTTNLDHIQSYAENSLECRRTIMLKYLGEEFDRKQCRSHVKTACDNCLTQKNYNDSFTSD